MKRARSSQTLPLVLLVASAVWAAPAADQRGGAAMTTVAGAYAVTFHVNTPPTVPDGATVTCKARIAPRLTAFENLGSQAVPVESVTGVAKVAGAVANCTVVVPFAFAVGNPSNGAELNHEIDVLRGDGAVLARSGQGIAVAYPQAGGTAVLRLTVDFEGGWER